MAQTNRRKLNETNTKPHSGDMLLVKVSYTYPDEAYSDGKVRCGFNGKLYEFQENEEVWLPKEVVDNSLRAAVATEYVKVSDEQGRVVYRQRKRCRFNIQIIDSKNSKSGKSVDTISVPDIDDSDIVDVEI